MRKLFFFLLCTAAITLAGCSTSPQPINFGSDNCDFCKMTISDQHYGAELITKKGKLFKFDDVHCIKAFIKKGEVKADNIASSWLVDFDGNGKLINANDAFLLKHESLRSPMNSSIAAFGNIENLRKTNLNQSGTELKWDDYLNAE